MKAEEIPWTEKYRPDKLQDVEGNTEAVEKIQEWVSDDSIPHVLLQGPAGVGKTASIVAFAKEKFGDDWRENLIQMNASDDRGIDTVRDEIKRLAQQSPSGQYQFKILHLDEADSMTNDAMNALRRIMEKYSDQTRFFLSCNYANELIDPLQSRCVNLPFKRLEDEEIESVLENIIDEEEIKIEDSAMDDIVNYVDGDARRAVHTLQMSVVDGQITKDSVEFVNLQADFEDVETMIECAVNGQMEKAMDINTRSVQPDVTDYSQFCKDVLRVLKTSDEFSTDTRFYAMSKVGEMERDILDGASPTVQVNSFLATLPVINNSSIANYE